MLNSKKIKCPVCKLTSKFNFFSSGYQPTNENVLYKNRNSALNSNIGEVKAYYCTKCFYAFNSSFDINLVDYGKNYQYTLPPTPTHKNLQQKIINIALQKYKIKNKIVLEIGCGKGEFLKQLCIDGNNIGYGFDTSYTGRKCIKEPQLYFYKSFFEPKNFRKKVDFIFARQVLEHLPDPSKLLEQMVKNLKNFDSTIYIEVPNLSWIIKNVTIWDFYYEHCSYLTIDFFRKKFYELGLKNIHTCYLYDGQYIGIFANRVNNSVKKKQNIKKNKFENKINIFKIKSEKKLSKIKNFCIKMTKEGNWAAWGGAAKGVTFTNLFKNYLNEDFFLIDINPVRQNRYVPCTGHKIISPKIINKYNPHTILVMNSVYFKEIKAYLKKKKFKTKLFKIEDF